MKCGSQNCERAAFARWAATIHDGRSTLTPVQATFLLCEEHDEWYELEQRQMTAVRIGPIANEVCLHAPSQRELRQSTRRPALHEPEERYP